jgi:hypothetical protein
MEFRLRNNLNSIITSLKSAWRWWRNLAGNPVYLREKGQWGRPNPFYDKVNRFSPFFLLAALVLGSCTAYSNPSLFLGNSGLGAFYCLMCLPGLLVNTLTLFGSFLAPALTAPSISSELNQGTWDILRLTPQSTLSILLAKLFGGLSRLPIWTILFVLTLIQSAIFSCSLLVASGSQADSWLPILLAGLSLLIRPWLEVLFAAFLGMYLSTWVRSAALALAWSYAGLVLFKLVNNSALWTALALAATGSEAVIAASLFAPAVIYLLATAALFYGLFHRAQKMS